MRCAGIYWFVPICAASLTVGLTVDYDVFLISRIYEYRHAAYSTEASILRAVGKQSTTITTAGCIMAIAFSSVRETRQSRTGCCVDLNPRVLSPTLALESFEWGGHALLTALVACACSCC